MLHDARPTPARRRAGAAARVRVLCLAGALVALIAAPAGAGAAARGAGAPAAGPAGWVRPVPGRVVRPFAPPRTRFGPGHLGADLAAVPGARVRAAGGGVVVFAGTVAGALHVVIRHTGGLRTSYSFLATLRVRSGEAIAAGAVVGTAGGRGERHDGAVVHLGLRAGDTYVDPMQLFAPDLAGRVHLAPFPATGPVAGPAGAPAARERAGLLAGLRGPGRPPPPFARLLPARLDGGPAGPPAVVLLGARAGP